MKYLTTICDGNSQPELDEHLNGVMSGAVMGPGGENLRAYTNKQLVSVSECSEGGFWCTWALS